MEFLSYAYDGRKSPFENLGRIKNPLQKPDDNSLSVPLSTIVNNSTQFSEDGWSEMSRKSFLSHPQSLETSYIDTNSRCNKPKPTQEPPGPAKRAKVTNTPSSAPTCQVLGCNKDLSSSKDYHKRHKVCDVHSKTAMVIVNGKEQRFCQQCSRFHVLPEFDEGKRSCRKRLAGHNERRKKPQLESYFGSSYFSTNASKTSSILPRAFPPSFYYPQCNNKTIIHNYPLKLEHSPIQIPSHPIAISNPIKVSPTKRGLNNTPSPVLEASVGSTNSNCALSLLSSQSNDLLNNSMSENVTPVIICPSQIVGQHQSETQTSHLSPEGSHTVSLVELSLYLQKVEQQKYYEKLCL